MKNNILVVLLIFIFSFPCISNSQNGVKEKLDLLMNECEENDLFSGTILAAYNGEILFERSTGFSNREKNILNNKNTKYNIGSIGKLFTSIMILQLAEEGKINLDIKISTYLPEMNKSVTIRQLLKHTSGYADYIRNPEFQRNKGQYKELKKLLNLISREQLLFEPGEKFSYSNSGYAILGGLIEAVTKKSYENNLSERILQPLSMNYSGFIEWEDENNDKAIGYITDITGKVNDNRDLQLHPSPAGGMYATAEDLLKLDRSLLNDNLLLKDESKVILFNQFNKESKASLHQILNNPDGENVEAGGAPGINALLMQYPGKKYTVIVMSNYDHAAEALEKSISDIIDGKDFQMPKLPIGRLLYKTLKDKGLNYTEDNFDKIIKEEGYTIENDMMLNNIGYQLLNNNMAAESIMIFKKNAELFPDVANCYDSLGEAYMLTGDKENAAASYAKVLGLDPNNENAKEMLKELK